MICPFCHKYLHMEPEHAGQLVFDLFLCRGCQLPIHDTLYRQLYYKDKLELLVDTIRVDNFYVIRYHVSMQKGNSPHSMIYKNIIGTFDSSPNMEPISMNKPVCDIDHVIDLPLHNIELLKHKLRIYTTFS